ncbi:arginine--tRNA ligase [Patescibacteria group bacterium]|nr:arginine--tRNA ligase [Patescibacteria group bacterium]
MIKDKIRDIIREEIIEQQQTEELPVFEIPEIEIEYPQLEQYGDYSSSVPLKLAAVLQRDPIEIGDQLVKGIRQRVEGNKIIERVELASPGFINFYLKSSWLSEAMQMIIKKGEQYGKSNSGHRKKIQVEFISANPTGPLHVGNGRGAFLGDTLANILNHIGYQVEREYYVNDIGKQVDILGESVLRRYLQHKGISVPYPEHCYKGDYIKDLAKSFVLRNYTLNSIQKFDEIKEKTKLTVLKKMLKQIKDFLENKLNIKHDIWFSEQSLIDSGKFEKIISQLKEKGHTFEKDGALWFKSTEFGDDKDRVLIKSDGSPTYFATDVAHHVVNYETNSKKINILGADHHGEIPRLKAALKALGYEDRLDVIFVQFVRLIEGGYEVKMSKRSGAFITLEELVEEVGVDVVRFFFLMYTVSTHMDFDLSLARKKSSKNPVFYVQYAHARICSIMEKLKKEEGSLKKVKTGLEHPSELILAKELIKLPDLLEEISQSYEVHRLPFYSIEIAKKFHEFYAQCKVIDEGNINEGRLELIRAAQITLQNVLSLMKVTAPRKM